MIMNVGFALPFILANYGQEGIAKLSMFDFMNGLLTFTFIYSIAVAHGDKKPDKKFILKKILISPPVWALFLGILANFAQYTPPVALNTFLKNLAALTSPLIMLALGLYFTPKFVYPKLIASGIFIRFFVGGLLGLVFSYILGLKGVDRTIALIFASAPLGFNTLTFSNMENLDTKFATSLISTGILLGLITVPLLIILL